MLNELIDAATAPAQMFPTRSARLMAAMDNVNGRFGRGMIRPGVDRRWTARAEFLSPRYTTRLDEIRAVRA